MQISLFEDFLNDAEILDAIANEHFSKVYTKLFSYLYDKSQMLSSISIGEFT